MTQVFRAWSPRHNRELETEHVCASRSAVEEACARAAQAAPAFARTGHARRAEFLARIAEELGRDAAAILECAGAETGLMPARLEGELARTRNQLLFLGGLVREGQHVDARIDGADPERKPLPRPDVRSLLMPIGPVAVFGASNFPLAFSTAGGDTASALAVGCPVVVKAHPLHPGTSLLAAAAIERARAHCGMPDGVFGHLLSGGERAQAVGIELVQDPRIEAVAFTGSLRGGLALQQAISARARPIPLFGELGALNPVFMLGGALQERATALAAQLFASLHGSAGQLCTRPGLVFLADYGAAREAVQSFCAALVQHAQAAATQPMLSPQHREQLRAQWSQRSRLPGVRVLRAESAGTHEIGPVLESCSLATLLEQPALLEECFGPGTLLVHCSSETELLRAAVSCPGSLTATVQRAPADEALARTLLATLLPRAGRLIVDGVPTGVEVNSSMQHGGPFPASTRADSTSVGGRAIQRWLRPVCFQNFPGEWLPEELQDANPLSLRRTVNGKPG